MNFRFLLKIISDPNVEFHPWISLYGYSWMALVYDNAVHDFNAISFFVKVFRSE